MPSAEKPASKLEKQEKSTQTYAALGVGLVCIIVGLPLWWKTTQVYRVQLPYSQIESLKNSQVEYTIDFTVIIFHEDVDKKSLAIFGENLKDHLENIGSTTQNPKVSYVGNIRHAYEEETNALVKSNTIEELDSALAKQKVLGEHGKYFVALLPKEGKWNVDAGITGRYRTAFFTVPSSLEGVILKLTHILREVFVNEASMSRSIHAAQGARHEKTDKETMRRLMSKPGYDVTFTLLNQQPDILNVQWDIEDAIKTYMQLFLDTFSEFVDISVKSQYLHYTNLYVTTQWNEEKKHFYLKHDDLPHIINPIEGHLGSHVSNNPHLNFIVYVPTRDQSPLHFYNKQGEPHSSNMFLSPRWGGIMVYNLEGPKQDVPLPELVKLDMKHVMEGFISQLRLLLGISPGKMSAEGVSVLKPGAEAIASWELDQWLRSRTLENVATATNTLVSLIQLLDQVKNIVINDDIGSDVERALEHIEKAQQQLRRGKLRNAMLASREAIVNSEKAFFDQSLLELLYFPDDQKFAIYIPLFLPISIPIIMSIIQAVKYLRSQRKSKKKD